MTVTLQRCGGVLTLTVQDNGIGMPAAPRKQGSGLPGIRDRTAAIGGRFAIETAPGGGTVLPAPIAPIFQPSCSLALDQKNDAAV